MATCRTSLASFRAAARRKGNPLIGADIRRSPVPKDSIPLISARLRSVILPFDSVYRKRREHRTPEPPDPSAKCDGRGAAGFGAVRYGGPGN